METCDITLNQLQTSLLRCKFFHFVCQLNVYNVHLLNVDSFFRNKDEITLERIIIAKVVIFGGPRRKFTASEVNCMLYCCLVTLLVLRTLGGVDSCSALSIIGFHC